jgi:hypothetical protein
VPTKRPCYIVELPTGVMVPTRGGQLVEATVRVGIRQSKGAAEALQKSYPGAIITKGWVETE